MKMPQTLFLSAYIIVMGRIFIAIAEYEWSSIVFIFMTIGFFKLKKLIYDDRHQQTSRD